MYVWTKKAELETKKLGLSVERKEGHIAMFGHEPVEKAGSILKSWMKKGYVKEI